MSVMAGPIPPKVFLAPDPPPPPETPSYEYEEFRNTDVPIVIDNGSSHLRAGWASDTEPRLQFENIIAKYRGSKSAKADSGILVGNDVVIAAQRASSKTAFENGVVANPNTLEQTLDYVFMKLGIDTDSVRHPVLMTETLCNPVHSRRCVSELLFECYNVPAVSYGIDSLFSYYANTGSMDAGMVVSSSHHGTSVIPILEGKGVVEHCKRLSYGGQDFPGYMLQLLQYKYSAFPHRVSPEQCQDLVHEHAYVSLDYASDLKALSYPETLNAQTRIVQFPFQAKRPELGAEEAELLTQKRREQGHRLQEQAARMREEKLKEKEEYLGDLKQLMESKLTETGSEFRRRMHDAGFHSEAELQSETKKIETAIRKSRNRMLGIEEPEEKVVPTFPLLGVPDDDLTPDQKREKKKQRLLKAGWDARERVRIAKEEEIAKEAEDLRLDEERRVQNPQGWLEDRRNARQALLARMRERRRRKAKLNDRRSRESKLRMRTLASLAAEDTPSKSRRAGNSEDTFGADDDDWGVYRSISKEDDSDEDGDVAQLTKLDELLLQHDPDFVEEDPFEDGRPFSESIMYRLTHGTHPVDLTEPAIQNQIHLNVERIRVPEVLFQPSIVGLDQAGIVEICDEVLKRFTAAQRQSMMQNVIVTGGNALLPNLTERIEAELRALQPFGSTINVRRAANPLLDAWKGAAQWARADTFRASAVARAVYDEMGHDYIVEHAFSNRFWQSGV
ncbi:uncharacterized protein EV422DRAFT_550513 [Fimicolochytrium jonesii]|uniref:uncharacterized protein n=1 Tax=Fimicolochytrium jonesii TaxID=1396493 RepID=UPI0022FEA3EA|nr:uncharacterized protein EV422DRAFT_550513 [Fimicolochytrium jonesii]KAI8821734.1 hypothetical protein EV422DRAFT_550513 [Fimicolochytrium jonesii]